MSNLLPCVLFLAASFFTYKNYQHHFSLRFIYVLVTSISLLLVLLCFNVNYFSGDNGVTFSFIYYFFFELRNGINLTGIIEYINFFLAQLFVYIVVVLLFVSKTRKVYYSKNKKALTMLAFAFTLSSVVFNPIAEVFYTSTLTFFSKENVKMGSDFKSFYKYPLNVNSLIKNKNLIFLYTESLEETYSNEEYFPNLTPNLNLLGRGGVIFSNIVQVDGATFTMGGMVASQCGIPLIGIPYGNSMSGMDSYLPSAECLGDILHKENYYLSYYGGADIHFAGKDLFYKTHHFDEVIGSEQLSFISETPLEINGWGVQDDSLFSVAYSRFLELSGKEKNFALFLLTLDTHQPNENPSKICDNFYYNNGENLTLNTVKCSDYLVARFIKKIQESPYGKSTVIVVVSDHLSPYSPKSFRSKDIKRRNRMMILSDMTQPVISEKPGSTLDIAATVLPFLGIETPVGLGRNLLDINLTDRELLDIRLKIKTWREEIMSFWNFPVVKDGLSINLNKKLIKIDGNREFKFPILIEVDKNLQTILRFQFDLEFDASMKKTERDLVSLAKKIAPSGYFILIDFCENTAKLKNIQEKAIFCLLWRKRGEYFVTPIIQDKILKKDDIKRMLDL